MGMRIDNRQAFQNNNLEFTKKYRGKKKFINQLATAELDYLTKLKNMFITFGKQVTHMPSLATSIILIPACGGLLLQ